MHWLAGKDCTFSYGADHGYLVTRGEREVRLTRFSARPAAQGLLAAVAREAAVNVIILPLGRGPGRPGGEPELDALVACAKVYAEAYEGGESLNGYPAWQRSLSAGPYAVRRHFHDEEFDLECRELHGMSAADPLADLRAADGHVPDYNRAEADRRLQLFRAPGDANGCPHC